MKAILISLLTTITASTVFAVSPMQPEKVKEAFELSCQLKRSQQNAVGFTSSTYSVTLKSSDLDGHNMLVIKTPEAEKWSEASGQRFNSKAAVEKPTHLANHLVYFKFIPHTEGIEISADVRMTIGEVLSSATVRDVISTGDKIDVAAGTFTPNDVNYLDLKCTRSL